MKARKGGARSKKSSGAKRRTVKRVNPFELKFDRVKHTVLGKTKKGASSGAPGLSRKRAFENRTNSLGIEWKQRGKVNKIVDRRLGVHDKTVSEEDKAAKRFAAQRLRSFAAATDDDIIEEEQLTHRGAALTSIQKYDQTMSDDDEEGDEIGADVVSIAHFGGGKEVLLPAGEESDHTSKRKDMIAELISKTKQQRFDKKMARDEQEGATDRLDEKWKELMQKGTIGSLVAQPGVKAAPRVSKDDYDTLFCELKMDHSKRGEATEREKTEGELANEERKRLQKLEDERLARMQLAAPQKNSDSVETLAKEKSKTRPKGFEVKYDLEGKPINAEKVKRARVKVVKITDESSDEEDISVTDESYDEGYEDEDFDQMLKETQADEMPKTGVPETVETSELPFVFKMPHAYDDLKTLLDGRSAADISLIISRLVKCHHPSLQEGNKKKLSRLLLYLIRFYDEVSKEGASEAEKLGFIAKSVFELLKFDAEYGARCVRALLRQQHAVHARSLREVFGFRAIALVMLVERLFPVTDVFHPVCTPTLAFALRLIGTVRVCSIRDAARIVLLITLLTHYVEESKRYLPEAIAFIRGLFLMAVENAVEERSPTATFPVSMPHRRMLYVENDCSSHDRPLVINLKDVFEKRHPSFEDSDHNRMCVLRAAVAVTCKFVLIYSTHTYSFATIFNPISMLLSRLPRKNYPAVLAGELFDLESAINAECRKCASMKQLQRVQKEAKMIEMLEPRFETNFNAEKKVRVKKGEKDDGLERKLFNRKYKKEMRGAMKELRKDSQFIAREKRRATAEDDRRKLEKTKALMRSLQGQESEYKKNLYMKQKP